MQEQITDRQLYCLVQQVQLIAEALLEQPLYAKYRIPLSHNNVSLKGIEDVLWGRINNLPDEEMANE